jgi:hypothetical protein
MDQAAKHFGDWWLAGTDNTGGWAATQMATGGADITNQYLVAGVAGGFFALIAFVLIIGRCFQNLGLALIQSRESSKNEEKLLWCCGAALFAHAVVIFSVSYFDQMAVAWWALIAMISSTTSAKEQESSSLQETENEVEFGTTVVETVRF